MDSKSKTTSHPVHVGLILFVTLFFGTSSFAKSPVDFTNDLIPLFTKHGCNAGACHGAAIGRGEFKLSLYGGDPAADYTAIVRELGGRRINLVEPENSLLVCKPTEQLEHGGEMVFDYDSESAELLVQWIRQGAVFEAKRRVERVVIEPTRFIAKKVGDETKLRTTAYYADGSHRDVTRWTVFTAEDPSSVFIDQISGDSKVLRRGRHIVVARYLNRVAPIELILPMSDVKLNLTRDNVARDRIASEQRAGEQTANFVDREVLKSLELLGLPPSGTIEDTAFLRRVTLDLTGRLPSPEQVTEMQGATVDRQALVEELLGSEEFTEYWTLQLSKLLRLRTQPKDSKGAFAYNRWLTEQLRDGRSYQWLAQQLIMATGDSHEIGPANFYRTTGGAREQAEFVSELFMGSRLRCANCHNHPLDRWTQDDYHGLAAIFAKLEFAKVVRPRPDGQTIHPRTQEAATPKIPGISDGADNVGREELAAWLTDESNPYFAKAIVNRLWKRMMGRGLVEPADDFRDTNPATHPALLDKLAQDFVDHGYRLRHTLKVIASSNAYARSAKTTSENQHDDRFYSHALRRPLEPEVLADAISDVLGVADMYGNHPSGMRAVALVDPKTPSTSLDVLGRCNREDSCEEGRGAVSGLSQQLHLINGDLLNARIADEDGRLSKLQQAKTPPIKIIENFYQAALTRTPTSKERDYWRRQLEATSDQQGLLEDFVWAILSSKEFATNH